LFTQMSVEPKQFESFEKKKGGIMALDKEKLVAAQAILKSLIESMPSMESNDKFFGYVNTRFKHCIKMAEEYATIDPDEEWVSTGVTVPKAYWDTRNQEYIGEGNRVQKNEKTGRWEIWTQWKDIKKFKEMMEKREVGNI